MSLLLDALHRASKDKDKIAAGAAQAAVAVPASAPTQPFAVPEPLTLEPAGNATPLLQPEPGVAASQRELSLSDIPNLLSDLPKLVTEPPPSFAAPGPELSLEIQTPMELVSAAPEAVPVPRALTDTPAKAEPAPTLAPQAQTAKIHLSVQSAEPGPVAVPIPAVASPQSDKTAVAPGRATVSADSQVVSPSVNSNRIAKKIRSAYGEKLRSAGAGKGRMYILGGIALALTMAMGSFFMGMWGDPLTLLGLGSASSLSPNPSTSAPAAPRVNVLPQPQEEARPIEPASAPSVSIAPAKAASQKPLVKLATLPASAPKALGTSGSLVSETQVRAGSAESANNKTDALPARLALVNSASRTLAGNEIVLRPAGANSVFETKNADPSPLDVAYTALVGGRLAESAQAYQLALKTNPQEIDALLGLAYIAQQQGQRDEAQAYYRRVLGQDPSNVAASTALLALEPQGSFASSSARVRELVAQQPQSAATWSMAGNTLVREGLLGEAAQMFARAQALEPGNLLHSYNHAVALDRLGQYAQARAMYQRLLKAAVGSVQPISRVFSVEVVRLRLEQLNQALGSNEQPAQ